MKFISEICEICEICAKILTFCLHPYTMFLLNYEEDIKWSLLVRSNHNFLVIFEDKKPWKNWPNFNKFQQQNWPLILEFTWSRTDTF